jgi:signal transduction histidine kinase/ligand-binding sensor domain-containing protein/DNA-binding response OmpR family regulator
MFKNHYINTLFYFLLFLATLPSAFAGQNRLLIPKSTSPTKIQFNQLPENLELSKMVARTFYQDSHGFLWVGTIDGLVRFDGYRNRIYRSNHSDSTSIAENQVVSMLEDKKGNFWIVNTNGKVNYFDPRTEIFKTIDLTWKENKPFPIIRKIILLEAQLWMYMNTGEVALLSLEDQSPKAAYLVDLKAENVADMAEAEGQLWISKSTGLFIWNKAIEQFEKPKWKGEDSELIENQSIGRLRLGTGSTLWAISDTLIYEINVATNHFKSYSIPQYLPFLKSPISRYNFMADAQNRLWFWTTSGDFDLSTFDTETFQIARFPASDSGEDGPLSNFMMDVFSDKNGTLWMGGQGGINYVTFNEQAFQIIKKDANEPQGLIDNHVRKTIEDRQGRWWIATVRGGLTRYDEKTQTYKSYRHQANKANSIPFNNINILLEDRAGHIWIGTGGGGLSKFNPNTEVFTNYKHEQNQPTSLSNNDIRSLYEDDKGNIWIGTAFGLNLYQPQTDDFVHYIPEDRGRDISIMSIHIDQRQQFWLSTYGSGLYQFDQTTGTFKVYRKEEDNPRSLSHNNALCIHEDKKGRLWISSSEGLNLYHPETDDFTKYTKAEGLRNDQIFGIAEDHHGMLWLSTLNGLIKFDPEAESFRAYTTFDGLPSNRFTNYAYGKSEKSGKLFFGGLDGLAVFHPDSLPKDAIFNPLVISNFFLYKTEEGMGKPINVPGIDYKSELNLSYLENTFTIEFAALDYKNAERINYAYLLEDVQKNWVNLGTHNELTFSNLAPGDYALRLKATNSIGVWNPTEKQLRIIIHPPWWKTTWAYAAYLLLFLTAAYAFYNLTLNRKIAQSKYQQLRELDSIKTQFYTNITHEFRTPLTIISGMAEKIKEEPKQWQARGVDMIRRNTYHLLSLINQMLDLQKLESGRMELHKIQGDIISYLRYILESFQSYAESKGLETHFLSREEELWMDYDPEKLLHIISNLLSNAIKFSEKGGHIYMQIACLEDNKNNRQLEIFVKDKGIGIPTEKLPYIFDRFYQVDGSSTREKEGTGVGLALTKELVHLFGGSIEVKSKIEKGTSFRILLPVTQLMESVENQADKVPIYDYGVNQLDGKILESSLIETKKEAIVLIIEDNLDVQTYLMACLQNQYQLLFAENGIKGIETAKEQIPDIIISDVMMPLKDGFEVCKELKEASETSHIPIILLTAKATMDDKIMGLKYGADAYLAKPFHPQELLIRLEKLIENRIRLQEKYSEGLIITKPSTEIEDQFLQKVQQIILNNLSENNFGPNELGKTLAFSRTKLHRKLKSLTGISTSNYINKIRLQEAKRLLKTTNLNISEIAYQVGFSTPQYFSTTFSKEMNCSPTEYRES